MSVWAYVTALFRYRDQGSLECSHHASENDKREIRGEEENNGSLLNKEWVLYVTLAQEMLNGAELVIFPLVSHFLCTIQRQCVKSQDATRSFMVVRSRGS